MKKKLLLALFVVVCVIFGYLLFKHLYNEKVLAKYDEAEYDSDMSPLLSLNIYESYVAWYNKGCIQYKNGEYEDAVTSFEKALSESHPDDVDCDIRINLALSMVYSLGDDYNESENIENSIAVLKDAKSVLLENECATEDGDGHSKDAEKLKREINRLIEELEEQQESQENSEDDSSDSSDSEDENSISDEEESEIEDTLKDIGNEALEEREATLEENNEEKGSRSRNSGGEIW